MIDNSKGERSPATRPWRPYRRAAKAALRPIPDPPRRILLASTGAPFPKKVVARTIELATPEHAKVTVLSIAKIYGTSFGIPHPALQPTKAEWQVQVDNADEAAEALRRKGFEVRVQVSRSRNASKMISRWAKAKNFHAIVVADPERPRWRRLLEGDPRKELNRRCDVPVYAVPVPATSHRSSRTGQQRRG